MAGGRSGAGIMSVLSSVAAGAAGKKTVGRTTLTHPLPIHPAPTATATASDDDVSFGGDGASVVRCSLPIVCRLLFVVRFYSSTVVGRSLLVINCSSSVVRHPLFVIRCLPFVVLHPLPAAVWCVAHAFRSPAQRICARSHFAITSASPSTQEFSAASSRCPSPRPAYRARRSSSAG